VNSPATEEQDKGNRLHLPNARSTSPIPPLETTSAFDIAVIWETNIFISGHIVTRNHRYPDTYWRRPLVPLPLSFQLNYPQGPPARITSAASEYSDRSPGQNLFSVDKTYIHDGNDDICDNGRSDSMPTFHMAHIHRSAWLESGCPSPNTLNFSTQHLFQDR
jgi:hypothetical protein